MVELETMLPTSINLVGVEETPATAKFSGSRYLFKSAAELFGVNLSEQEDRDWAALLGGAYLVDHILDIEKDDIMPHLQAITEGNGLPHLHVDTQVRFRNYMLRQDENHYDDIMRRLEKVNGMVHRMAEANKPEEVIKIRLEEAGLLAHLLSLSASRMDDELTRLRFNDWLSGWSRCGYVTDSFMDMHVDYETGDSGLRPTPAARAVLGHAAIRESLVAARKTPTRLIGKCAVVAAKYLVFNKKPAMTQAETSV